MAEPWEEYTKELYKKFKYYGTWAPGEPRRLGDVGVLHDKYRFRRVTSLANLGIEFEMREDATADKLDYTSSSGVSIGFKAKGELPSPGSHLQQSSAGITVQFSRNHGMVLRFQECTFVSIEDQVAVGESVLALWKAGKWKENWVVIDHLCVAGSATILMSNSNNATVEIAAGTKVSTPTDDDLGSVDAELKIAWQSSMETSYVAEKGLTPLFLASGLRDEGLSAVSAMAGLPGVLDRLTPADVSSGSPLADRISFGPIRFEETGVDVQRTHWTVNEPDAATVGAS